MDPILMPPLGEIEIVGKAAIALAEGGGIEHALAEVLGSGAARVAADEATSVTAREFIALSVEKGQIPKSLYANSERFAGLTNPRTVTVENQFLSNSRFFLRREAQNAAGFKPLALYSNGEKVGLFDSKAFYAKEQFPLEVKSVNLTLSDGRSVSVAARDVPVIERWQTSDFGRPFPEKALALSGQPVKISPFTTLTFTDASALRPGAKLISEFPFQRLNGELTNGVWRFPLEQRMGMLPGNISQLPAEHYGQFLQALEGKTAGEASLPEWIKFDGTSNPVASREAFLNPRPRVESIRYPALGEQPNYSHSVPRLKHFDALAGGKSVTVESVNVTPHQVSLRLDPREGNYLDQGVYVDGKRVGAFDSAGELSRSEAPSTINTATVKLTDGRELAVSSRRLSVVKDWGAPTANGRWQPTVDTVFSTAPVPLTPIDRLSFRTIAELKPGTTFSFDKPFEELGGKLTDGIHQFPIKRGYGQYSHIAEEHWQQFLTSLRGKSLSEATLPEWAKVSTNEPSNVVFDRAIRINERPLSYKVTTSAFRPTTMRPESPPALIQRLTGAENLTVTDMKLTQHELSLKLDPQQGQWMDQSVYLNGERVGSFDPTGGIARHEFPLTITTADLTLSNGKTLSTAERALRVVKDWGERTEDGFVPKYKTVLSTNPVRVSPWETRSFEGASKVQVGDQFGQRYPFQWVDEKLTNGKISLPKVRPEGAQWRNYPMPAVPAGYYDSYLSSLEGKTVDNVMEAHPRILTDIKTERELAKTASRPLTDRQFEMWNGLLGNGKKVDYVSLSHGVIFPVPTEAGNTIFAVDNPGAGAIYLFKEQAAAEKLATNSRTIEDALEQKGARKVARDAGARFIVHSGEWKEKLADAIRQMSREVDTPHQYSLF